MNICNAQYPPNKVVLKEKRNSINERGETAQEGREDNKMKGKKEKTRLLKSYLKQMKY